MMKRYMERIWELMNDPNAKKMFLYMMKLFQKE